MSSSFSNAYLCSGYNCVEPPAPGAGLCWFHKVFGSRQRKKNYHKGKGTLKEEMSLFEFHEIETIGQNGNIARFNELCSEGKTPDSVINSLVRAPRGPRGARGARGAPTPSTTTTTTAGAEVEIRRSQSVTVTQRQSQEKTESKRRSNSTTDRKIVEHPDGRREIVEQERKQTEEVSLSVKYTQEIEIKTERCVSRLCRLFKGTVFGEDAEKHYRHDMKARKSNIQSLPKQGFYKRFDKPWAVALPALRRELGIVRDLVEKAVPLHSLGWDALMRLPEGKFVDLADRQRDWMKKNYPHLFLPFRRYAHAIRRLSKNANDAKKEVVEALQGEHPTKVMVLIGGDTFAQDYPKLYKSWTETMCAYFYKYEGFLPVITPEAILSYLSHFHRKTAEEFVGPKVDGKYRHSILTPAEVDEHLEEIRDQVSVEPFHRTPRSWKQNPATLGFTLEQIGNEQLLFNDGVEDISGRQLFEFVKGWRGKRYDLLEECAFNIHTIGRLALNDGKATPDMLQWSVPGLRFSDVKVGADPGFTTEFMGWSDLHTHLFSARLKDEYGKDWARSRPKDWKKLAGYTRSKEGRWVAPGGQTDRWAAPNKALWMPHNTPESMQVTAPVVIDGGNRTHLTLPGHYFYHGIAKVHPELMPKRMYTERLPDAVRDTFRLDDPQYLRPLKLEDGSEVMVPLRFIATNQPEFAKERAMYRQQYLEVKK